MNNDKLKINGQEYCLDVTWGKFKKVIKIDTTNPGDNLINYIWAYIRPRFWIVKPFLFKWRMANKITFPELKAADALISQLLKMEDREGKNSDI